MKINKLRCLLISDCKENYARVVACFQSLGVNNVPILPCNKQSIYKSLMHSNVDVLLIDDSVDQLLQIFVAKITHQQSHDTILVFLSRKYASQAVTKHASSLEYCIISYQDIDKKSPFLKTVLSYSTLKFHFRQAKTLLAFSEQRIERLVRLSQNPIAYINNFQHVVANNAYLKLFSIKNNSQLRAISLASLLFKDDVIGFHKFYSQHTNKPNQNNSLLIKMVSLTGLHFEVKVQLIPVIYQRVHCDLLWVRLEKLIVFKHQKDALEKVTNTVILTSKSNQSLVNNVSIINSLDNQLKAKRLKLVFSLLTCRDKEGIPLYMVSLALPNTSINEKNQWLTSTSSIDAIKAYDRLLLSKILSYYFNRTNKQWIYIVTINIETLLDDQFRVWMVNQIASRNNKPIKNIMITLSIDDLSMSQKQLLWFKKLGFEFVITDFIPSNKTMNLVTMFTSTFIWFSKSWLDIVVLNLETLKQFNQSNYLLQQQGKKTIASILTHQEAMLAIKTNYIDAS